MKYICKIGENFGFKDDKVNEILGTDIEISEEMYNKFFKLQSEGKQFKIKNISATTFEEMFEEVIPEVQEAPREESPIEKLQKENKELKKQIEDTQQSMAEIMNLIEMQPTP